MKKLWIIKNGKVHFNRQKLLIMRLSALLLTINLLQVCAVGFSQTSAITYNKENPTIKEVLSQIEEQGTYKFLYRDADIENKTISLKSGKCSIDELLTSVLPNSGNTYRILDNNLVVIMPSEKMEKQDMEVTGTVTDATTGEPLPGVNVIIEGTTLGVITNTDGKYSLNIPDAEAVLLFSFMGYLTESITVGDQNIINVQLVPDIKTLEEIVVIGYGTTTRKNFTGATTVAQVENTPLALIPKTDVMDVLRGTVPGMTVSQQLGAGQSPSLLIRGQRNIQNRASDPLIVLNGIIFMGAVRDIDPTTIESISILKDAASVAAYGSRAANGVVMINTLRGKIGKPIITFKSTYGKSKVINKADVLSPEDWIKKVNLLQGLEEDADPTSWMSDFEDENYETGITSDWQDYAERTGNTQNHSLSISGASEKMNYYLSGSYTKTAGVLIGDDYDRRSLTSNITTDITDWLKVGGNITYSFNDYSGPTNYDIYQTIRTTPYGRIYRDEENGLIEKYPATEGLYRTNPLWNIKSGTIDDHDIFYTTILDGNTLIKCPWIEGLSYHLNYSYTYRSIERDYFTHEGFYIPEGTSDDRYSPATIAEFLTNANGFSARTKDLGWVWDNIINFKRVFDKHNIDITGVYTRDSYEHKYKRIEGSDFSELGNTTLSYNGLTLAQTQLFENFDNWEKTNIGYLGRINYSYADKYHITASIRRDGASVFGADEKWGLFPAFGVAWTLTEESFMNNIQPINYLKLKFTWGINGNQTLPPYRTLSTLSLGQSGEYSYPFGNTSEPSWGQRINRLGNTYLKWEETSAFNGGFELNMFNNLIELNIEVYKSKTLDQIFTRNIPVMAAGITRIDATMGQVDNFGIEGILKTKNINRNNFEWNSACIFYINKNKLVELYGDGEDDIANSLFLGKSLGAIYGYKEVGIIQEEGDEDYIEINGGVPGDVKFGDKDGNDTINENDKDILGYNKELINVSLANTFSYKNFELYALITGIFGGKDYYKAVNLYAYRTMSDVVWDNNFNHIWWTPENKSNIYPRVGYANPEYTPLQSRSFLRLQNISLSYTFRQPWIKKQNIDNLKLYLSATNVFTITKWEGGDPETGQTLSSGGYGYGYPLSAVYSIGINLTF